MVPHIPGLEKGHNSKFEEWFLLNAYRFQTIMKSELIKSKHCKGGTVSYTLFPRTSYLFRLPPFRERETYIYIIKIQL